MVDVVVYIEVNGRFMHRAMRHVVHLLLEANVKRKH
jgi:hypothetical protein